MPEPRKLVAVILAASEAKRFGGCKQLTEVNGKPMISHVIKALESQVDKVVVITGAYREQVEDYLKDKRVVCHYNENFSSGLFSSVICAAKVAGADKADLLLTLADLPFVTAEDYSKLIERAVGEVMFSRFQGSVVGPPAVFPFDQPSRLESVSGEQGAKHLFKGAKTLDLPNASRDIDSKSDLS